MPYVSVCMNGTCLGGVLSVSNNGPLSVFNEQHGNHHMGKEWDTLQKSLTVLEKMKSLTVTDPS